MIPKHDRNNRIMKPHRVALAGSFLAPACFTLACLLAPPAMAHPHVVISVKTTVVSDASGAITALRHAWTFDEAFSTFSTQGLDKNKDGKLDREELADLAKVNVESLSEYGYFTEVKTGKDKASFGPVQDYYLSHDGKALTLHYTLPLSTPRPLRDARLVVDDPSYFVAFGLAPDSPVSVEGSPCKAKVKAPKAETTQRLSQLSEADFASGKLGNAEWASAVSFECP